MRDAQARRARRLRGHMETIGERFERDRAAFLPLPAARFEACDKTTVRVSSISLVRYSTNDYSVPTEYGHRQVLVKAYVHRIVIVSGCEVIAEHQRSYEREATIFDPLHYLALLEHKSRALDQAAPLAGWQLPECFAQLRRLLEARLNKHGPREYIQVLRLAGDLPTRRSHRRRRAGTALNTHQLRRRAASGSVPHRTQAAAAGHGQLAAPAAGPGAHHARRRLHEPAVVPTAAAASAGGGAMSTTTPDTPQVLLEHHLKALRLPTMLREYDKLARTCAQEKATFPTICCG